MLSGWLRKQGNHAFIAAYVVIGMGAAQTEDALGWLLGAALASPLALWAWTRAIRQRRLMDDTPTSRVASAAQGYVELQGIGKTIDSGPIYSHLKSKPCLWFRYQIEKRDQENKWHTEDRGESQASFVLDDGSARCLIDPEGAEIVTEHSTSWHQGNYRYHEWWLLPEDRLYALGEFSTINACDQNLDLKADVGALLAEWKKDPHELRRRFDLNGDGEIDAQEWALARQAARREIDKQHRDLQAIPATHYLSCPTDNRPYLLTNLDPDQLGRRYGWWAVLHFLVFLCTAAALPWLWQMIQTIT
jgi:hypothetical protein